jgi:Eco57I restriction-modification methylase
MTAQPTAPAKMPWQPRLLDGEANHVAFAPGPLAAALAAVPTMIAEVGGWPADRRGKEAEEAADVIASGADALWLTDSHQIRRSEVSPDQVGAAIATGLAILAHRAGGVRFGGLHWHADPTACVSCPGLGVWTDPTGDTPRATRGVFYTSRALAEEVVTNALGVLLEPVSPGGLAGDIEGLRVADIACGSGAFLVAACRFLADALAVAWAADERATALDRYQTTDVTTAARAHVAGTCLFGVDIDPLPVELAALALQLLAPSVQPAGGRLPGLRVGDALIGRSHPRRDNTVTTFPGTPARLDWPEAFPDVFRPGALGFDAIVGNPPWLGGLKLPGALGVAYREHLVAAVARGVRGSADLAAYFWLRAHELVSPFGVVGVVGPHALLRGASARVGRDQLTRRGWRPYREVTARTWPARPAAVCCCLVWTHLYAHPPVDLRDRDELPIPGRVLVGTVTTTVDGADDEIRRYVFDPDRPRHGTRLAGRRRGGQP